MRPNLDQYLMELAKVAATRTTCIRRGVGCVLANSKGHVLSIGYNGVAKGQSHCNEPSMVRYDPAEGPTKKLIHACKGYDLPPGKDNCEAIHAEQNALLQCHDPWAIDTAYITLSPCKPCVKLLANTSCRRIIFLEEHVDLWARDFWTNLGRVWQKLD